MNKIYYTYAQAEKDCRVLVKDLEGLRFDWIVTMARGGLIPACIISQLLGIKKIKVVVVHHYKGEKRVKGGPRFLADWIPPRRKKILLIDDVVDTGKTMKMVYKALKQWDNEITTASLHYKPKQAIGFEPDYWANETDAWVVYPWEFDEK